MEVASFLISEENLSNNSIDLLTGTATQATVSQHGMFAKNAETKSSEPEGSSVSHDEEPGF